MKNDQLFLNCLNLRFGFFLAAILSIATETLFDVFSKVRSCALLATRLEYFSFDGSRFLLCN